MTSWQAYKREHPLSDEAKAAYERERRSMGVGYFILRARSAAGLTQAELAERIGSSQPNIARWESGAQSPSVTTLLKIADATDTQLQFGFRNPGDSRPAFNILGTLKRGDRGAEIAEVLEETRLPARG